jgi:NAD(P)-dependent dehydrogenase (short-subunit alcohol dehydrogenase family)
MQGYLESAFSLEGQTAIITGGARGIGMAIATSMAKAGANIVIWDIQEELSKETAARIAKEYGVRTWHFCSDITRKEEIKGNAEKIISMTGKVGILVNNAGVQVRKPALDFTVEEWTRVIETHLSATFFISQAIIPHMAANGGGQDHQPGFAQLHDGGAEYNRVHGGEKRHSRIDPVDVRRVGFLGHKHKRHSPWICGNRIDEEPFFQSREASLGYGKDPDETLRRSRE